MSCESVTVAILLSSENIPKEIFLNSVDEYFGPQVEDFKKSSLSICILSDKTGFVPSKINSAIFIKSQWMFQTTLSSNEIFEFKLTICENKSWSIVLSEDLFENRLIKTFEIPIDKTIVVHLEWNKPHTVSVESLIDLYSMDESLIKSHYENQETSELFKNLETITEDNFDDESLIDSLREESKKVNGDNKTENHDTDDSLETIKEYEKGTIKITDYENKIDIPENYVINKVDENIDYFVSNGDNDVYSKSKKDCRISYRNSQRKDVLLKNIQSILGVKSELDQIKSSNLMKDRNFIIFTNLEKKNNFLSKKCKIQNNLIYLSELETDNFCNTFEIGFKEGLVLHCIREAKELKLTVALELSLHLNIRENIFPNSSHCIEDIHVKIIKDNITCDNHELKIIQLKLFENDNLNSNKLVIDNIANNLKIQNYDENEEISSNHQNTTFFVECSMPIEEEASLKSDVTVNILTQPYLCVLVLPSEEIQNIKFSKEFKAIETFENVSADFYHENLLQPKINNAEIIINENMNSEKEVLDLLCQSEKELSNFKTSRYQLPESKIKNKNYNTLVYEHDLNFTNSEYYPENMINQSDVNDGSKRENFDDSMNSNENLKYKNEFSSIKKFKDQIQDDKVQLMTQETPPNVGNIIVKFETLKEIEISHPKIWSDKQKDQNRISDIVKQFEELNSTKEESISEMKNEDIEKLDDKKNKPFKSLKENNFFKERNSISKENQKDTLIIKDDIKRNIINNQEQQPELRINDDYKYPDSVTPTKVEHTLSQLKVYDVPFIDDDVFIKDSSFKESSEKLNIREFHNSLKIVNSIIKITPKASIETLQEIEIEKIKLSIETEEPVKKRKGLLDLCGCVGGRKRS